MSAIAIKIECECGQHYAFDIEPINGQMPAPVACPVCGADGTAAANEILSHATPRPPRLVPADTSPAWRQGGRLVPGLRAPANDDAKRDWIEAKLDIKRATRILFIVVWTVLFLCGSALLLWVPWRIYFALTGAPKQRPGEQTFILLGLSYVVVPLATAVVGIVLGIRGRLPGTGRIKQ